MIRTTLALATAGLFLVACDAKPTETAKAAEPAVAVPSGPNAADADAAAAAKAMTDMAASMNTSGEITNPKMKAFVDSFDEMVNTVLTVKTEADAKAIGPKMKPILAKIDEQSKALETLPEAERQAASMQSLGRIMAATTKMAQHVSSLPPEVQKTLNEEMEKLPQPKMAQ